MQLVLQPDEATARAGLAALTGVAQFCAAVQPIDPAALRRITWLINPSLIWII
jgi:hypothetical protein